MAENKAMENKVQNTNQKIMEMKLLGQSDSEISKETNLAISSIKRICNSPLFLRELKRQEFAILQSLEPVKDYMRGRVFDLVDWEFGLAEESDNETVRLNAIKDLLDRIGMDKTININIRGAIATAQYSVEELKRIVTRRLADKQDPTSIPYPGPPEKT